MNEVVTFYSGNDLASTRLALTEVGVPTAWLTRASVETIRQKIVRPDGGLYSHDNASIVDLLEFLGMPYQVTPARGGCPLEVEITSDAIGGPERCADSIDEVHMALLGSFDGYFGHLPARFKTFEYVTTGWPRFFDVESAYVIPRSRLRELAIGVIPSAVSDAMKARIDAGLPAEVAANEPARRRRTSGI